MRLWPALLLLLNLPVAAFAKKKPAPPEPESVAVAAMAPTVELPHEQFTLSNGLRVVVREDRKAPVVAVGIWYGVGSANEPPGRTGFAHLFEHLMFNGSENFNQEFFGPFEQVGATDQNGTTWFDRTNYFENVPTPALELALWMESDRMGHLLGVVDQGRLDEQRGVVQNEKRQGDNDPYGKIEYHRLAGLYPVGHPYRHSTIGSMEDLDAATLDDVKTWFEDWYGAANTVLVLVGDIDVDTARPLVEKYFGWIEAGPPVPRIDSWVPIRTENIEETLQDRVPQVRIQRVWTVPGRTSQALAQLELAATVLGGGKTSRLSRALMHDRQLCTQVRAEVDAHQLASELSLDLTVTPGADPDEVIAVLNAVIGDFLRDGPTVDELSRARISFGGDLVRRLEKVGGFGGQSAVLAQGLLYADDPGFFFDQRVSWVNAAGPADVANTARTWMARGYYQVTVRPFGEHESQVEQVDRSQLPAAEITADLAFPEVQEATLDSGTRVLLAERHEVPLVQLALQFDAGYAADPRDRLGLASFAAGMLDEGTTTRDSLELASALETLGAELDAWSTLDTTTVQLSALSPNLTPSVALLADVVQNPAFADEAIERLRQRALARIAQEQAEPNALAMRLLPPELYGPDHPYGVPLTGTGLPEAIEAIDAEGLRTFHAQWLRPDNATLIVVGDVTMEALLPTLNTAFATWKAPEAPLTEKALVDVPRVGASKVILIDKPDAEQSLILVGQLAPPSGGPDDVSIDATNDVLGGQFSSRLNMNLREDKHWAYGAYSFMFDARGQRPYMVFAPVQTDRTAESMVEVDRELRELLGKRPPTAEELGRTVNNNVRSLPGRYETQKAVLRSLSSSVTFGRPFDWPTHLGDAFGSLTVETLKERAAELIHPDQLVWIVVGDLAEIEGPVRALELGTVEVRD